MRRRDGLLLAPILLVGVLLASLIVSPKPLSEPMLWAVTAFSGVAILAYAGLAVAVARPSGRRGAGLAAQRAPIAVSPDDGDA